MSITTNIGLFKHDNPATNTDEFNVDKALNQNWDKLDTAIGKDRERITTLETDNTTNKQDITDIKAKDTEQDKYISELELENSRLREDLNGLPKGQVSGETLDLTDSAEMRCDLKISGNSKQEPYLPKEYTQVDYIESTSYAYNYNYINTGIFPTNNTSIEMSVNIPSDITHSYDRLFGSGTLLSVLLDNSNQNKARVLWNKTLSSNYSLIDVPFGIKNIIKQDKNVTYLNGEKILEFSNGNFEDDKELRLFSSLEDSADRDGILKLYYCKIWENDILKRNFIPCYRNSDNEIGLYDTVNNVFYTNQGTGTFIKGNDSSLPSPDYPSEVESCGDNGSITEVICNKNWFDKDKAITKKGWFDNNGKITYEGNSTIIENYIKIPNNKNITINAKGLEHIVLYNKDKEFIKRVSIRDKDQYTFKEENVYFIRFQMITSKLDLNSIQIEEGTTAKPYVEHKSQTYTIPTQQPMRSVGDIRDTFIKKNNKWYEHHPIVRIESYNGGTITSEYMSNTGELSTGATVDYISEIPLDIECTEEQNTILDKIEKEAKTYKNITHMYSTDNVSPVIDVTYKKDIDTMITNIEQAILSQGGNI